MSNEHTSTGGGGGWPGRDGSGPGANAVTGEELDDLLAALADENRRQVLTYLDGADEDVAAFSDLVEHVVDDSPEDPVARERAAVNLHHDHLPKLADADLVEYDPRSETVRYRGGPVVAEWLNLVRSHRSDRTDS